MPNPGTRRSRRHSWEQSDKENNGPAGPWPRPFRSSERRGDAVDKVYEGPEVLLSGVRPLPA